MDYKGKLVDLLVKIIILLDNLFHPFVLFGCAVSFFTFIILFFNMLTSSFVELKKKKKLINGLYLNYLPWVLLLIIGLYLRVFYTPHYHFMFIDEHMYMDAANKILHFKSFFPYWKSIGWPFLISIAYFFFGINNYTAIYLSSIFGFLTIIVLFALSYALTRNKQHAFYSVLLLTFFPLHILWSGSAETNITSIFFTTLSVLLMLLFYRKRTMFNLLLVLSSIAFTSQIRPENYTLFVLFIIGCFLFSHEGNERFWELKRKIKGGERDKKNKDKENNKDKGNKGNRIVGYNKDWLDIIVNKKQIFILTLVFLLISLPNFFMVAKITLTNDWFVNNLRNPIDMKDLTLSKFINNIIVFSKPLMDGTQSPIIITLLFLFGFLMMIFDHDRELFFLTIWLFLFGAFYFFSAGVVYFGGMERYYLALHLIILIIAGYGLMKIMDWFINVFVNTPKYNNKKGRSTHASLRKPDFVIIDLLLILIVSGLFFLNEPIIIKSGRENIIRMEAVLTSNLRNLPRNCTLVVNYKEVVGSVLYKANTRSLQEFFDDVDAGRIDSNQLNKGCYIFINDQACVYKEQSKLCNRMKQEFNLELIKDYAPNDAVFKLYYIKGISKAGGSKE